MSMGVYPGGALFSGKKASGVGLRKRSYNMKLERRINDSYPLPRNTTSRDVLRRLEEERAKREQEKEEQRAKKDEELFKRIGIKAPTGISHDSSKRTEGVVADLQKYRLGNVRPRKEQGMTEELENILYPPPHPALQPIMPMTYGDYQYSGQASSEHSHSSIHARPSYYPNHPPPVYPPIPPVLPQQATGWSWSPDGGWIYRPPFPAPPPMFSDPAVLPSGPSPQHHSSSSEFQAYYAEPGSYHNSTSPPGDSSSRIYLSKPKSILRSSGTDTYRDQWSDPPSSTRQVRFRETPDVAPPHYPSYHSPCTPLAVADPGITTPSRQVPRWKLHKNSGDRKRSVSLDSGSHQALSRNGDWGNHTGVKSRSRSLQDHGTHRSTEVTHGGNDAPSHKTPEEEVPPILQQAHERLLDLDDLKTGMSGKRSGRTLIQELERMAEHMSSAHIRTRHLPQSDRHEGPPPSDSANRTGLAARTQRERAPSPNHSQVSTRFNFGGNRVPRVSQNPDRADKFYPIPSQENSQPHDEQFSEDESDGRSPTPEVPDCTYSLRHGHPRSSQSSQSKSRRIDHHITDDTDHPDHHSYSQTSHHAPPGSQTSVSNSRRRDKFALVDDKADVPYSQGSQMSTSSSRRRSLAMIVDKTDTLYHPSSSPSPSPSPELNELEDRYSDRPQSVTPEHPSPKRFKLTDGAWVRYNIPSDKLPPTSPMKPRAAKRPDARVRYGRMKSEPASQVSQIEEPEDSQDRYRQEDRYNQDETIESNWSYSQSDRERGQSRGKLDRIVEDDEDDEDEFGGGRREIPDLEPVKNGSWVEPGFFEKIEALPFTIWRDGY